MKPDNIIIHCSHKQLHAMMELICQEIQLSLTTLTSGRNSKEVATARQVICYFLFCYTKLSLQQIGQQINRSRPAVYYNISAARKHLDTADPLFTDQWKSINMTIQKIFHAVPAELLKNHYFQV